MIWYFKVQDIRADALEEGIGIGRQEEAWRIARNMLDQGMAREMILELTGLSQADLDTIQGELNTD